MERGPLQPMERCLKDGLAPETEVCFWSADFLLELQFQKCHSFSLSERSFPRRSYLLQWGLYVYGTAHPAMTRCPGYLPREAAKLAEPTAISAHSGASEALTEPVDVPTR
jgi:hypothetical protein